MKVKHYIIRYLRKIGDDYSREKTESLSSELTTLSKIIQNKSAKDGSRRIVILGEAGSGKSTELFYNASQLYNNRDRNNVPIFIPLNTYTGDNFKDYAIAKLGQDADTLLNYDKPKLVFFLDEFDQVINKESATRQIRNFIDLYSEAMFIISSRSNFYTNQFPEFDRYFLSPFDEDNIAELSKAELSTSYNQFISQIISVRIKEIAKIPFFLNYLIEIFKKNNSIPDSQTDVLEMVINNALTNDLSKLSEFDLTNEYPLDNIRKDLALISLILEVLQRNHLSAGEVNEIMGDNFKSSIIMKLSLIDESYIDGKKVFQFLHNNFNEYLAAKCLSMSSFDEIISFLSVKAPMIKLPWSGYILKLIKYFNLELYGLKILDIVSDILGKKRIIGINPSWINTLGLLSQLRNNRDIINYLVKHEPEIALKIELSRLTEDDRYAIFESIFNEYRDKKITIQEDIFFKLADIISISDKRKPDIYGYLMRYATKGAHYYHRYNALHLLCHVKGDYKTQIIETMIHRINDPSENDYVKHICMISLVELGATRHKIIDRIIKVSDTDSDYILSGVYYLLSKSPDVDKYIDVLLAGIPKSKLKRESHGERLGDESYFMTKCLERISSPSALNSITDFLSTNSDSFRDYNIKILIPNLIKNLTEAYKTNNSVYDSAKKLLLSAERARSDELSEIGNFFINTETALRIFEDLFSQGFDKHYDALAVVANDDTLGLLIDKHMKGNISEDDVWNYLIHTAFKNRNKYQKALNFINTKTDNIFIQEPPIDYNALERERYLRKVEIIFNKTEFLKELKNIFEVSKKDMIKYQDTIDLENENINQNLTRYNSFVLDEIQNILIQDEDKEWSFDALVDKIDKFNYDVFTFEHITKLLYDGSELDLNESQIKFIKDYCKTIIKKVDFKSSLSASRNEEGNITTKANNMAIRIWLCKRKLNINLSESILLDMLSFDWVEGSGYCGIDYLLEHLDPVKVSERIKENLKAGIKIAPVLINHVEYCLKNNIDGILDYVYDSMNREFISNYDKQRIMEILIKFQDGKQYIKKYLRSNDKELYLKAAELLGDTEDVKEIIRERLNDSNIEIAEESAKLLIPDQNMDAIEFYINHIINSRKFKEAMHSPIGKIETIEALNSLGKLLLYYFEHHKEMEESYSFMLTEIIQALKNIARKDSDYRNLRKVDHLLAKFIKKHEKKWEFVVHLNRFRDEIENEYYANYKEVNNLREAIDKMKALSC